MNANKFHLGRTFTLLLPVLALAILVGLLSLTPADSVQARPPVWSATLTVGGAGAIRGCDTGAANISECSTALTEDEFTYNGTDYLVQVLRTDSNQNNLQALFNDGVGRPGQGEYLQNALSVLTLTVNGTVFKVSEARFDTGGTFFWDYDPNPDWAVGDTVTLSLDSPTDTGVTTWVTAVDYASSPPNGSDYRRGDHVAVAVTWNQPVTAVNDKMWVTLELDEGSGKTTTIEARYDSGSGTNRFIFTDIVADGDAAPNGFTVPRGNIRFNPKNRRHYEGFDWTLRNINSAGKAAQVINGGQGRVSCNAEGSHCLVSRYSWLVPAGVPPGRSFRLLFIAPGVTAATETNISYYDTLVQNSVANKDVWKELQPHLRAVANATQGGDLKTNTRTQPPTGSQGGDLGAWTPIFWVGGNKVANSYADFYSGAWIDYGGASSGFSGPDGPFFDSDSVPTVWTGSSPDGSPDARLGSTRPTVGDPLEVGQELYYSTEPATAAIYNLYAITPLLTVQWEPKNR